MQTIKTAVVVVLLLFVLYGGYVALNGTDTPLAEELENLVSLDETSADVAGPGTFQPANPAVAEPAAGSAFERFASRPLPNFSPSNGASLPAPPPVPSTIPSVPSMEIPDLELPSSDPGSDSRTSAPAVPPAASNPPFGNPSTGTTSPAVDSSSMDVSSAGLEPKVNATNVSVKSEPGFGLALPGGKAPDSSLLPKLPPSTNATVPALDLPSLHGEAKNLAEMTSERSDTAATNAIPTSKPGRSYENAKQLAMDQIQAGRLKEALATLSVFYNAQELTSSQRADLLDLLDALAREVIYSRRHHMDFAYVIAPNETLEQVCKTYNVPTEVMIRINGLDPTIDPPAGTQLKIIPGPFRAEVDLTRSEFTLFIGDLYAGRYPASFGVEPQPKPGVYQVVDKKQDRNYYSSNGMQISANDPNNPYGGFWIDLGNDVCIHGSPVAEGAPGQLGCISLSPLDAGDVFGMLGRGSQVTIRR